MGQTWPQQEVFRGVAGQREFGEDNNIGAVTLYCTLSGQKHLLDVRLNCSNCEIKLRDADCKALGH